MSVLIFLLLNSLLVFFMFVLLHYAYAWLLGTFGIKTPARQMEPYLWDRLIYLAVFVLGASLLFKLVLPYLSDPRRYQNKPVIRSAERHRFFSTFDTIRSAIRQGLIEQINHKSMLWGLGGGLLCYGMVALLLPLSPIPQRDANQLFKETLLAEPLLLTIHFGGSTILTPIMEEYFYRYLLTGWIRQSLTGMNADMTAKGPNAFSGLIRFPYPVLWYLLPVTLFGLMHPSTTLFMLACGMVFTILYLRYGLLAAIIAHCTYNMAVFSSAMLAT